MKARKGISEEEAEDAIKWPRFPRLQTVVAIGKRKQNRATTT